MKIILVVLLHMVTMASAQIEIGVLYSAFNPESKHFITKELVPVWEELKDHVIFRLIFVPSGRAKIDPNNPKAVQCENGPEECEAHRVHNCVNIDPVKASQRGLAPIITGEDKQIRMTSCLMLNGKKGSPYPIKQCLKEVGIVKAGDTFEKLKKCAELPPDPPPPLDKTWNYQGNDIAIDQITVTKVITIAVGKDPAENISLPLVVIDEKTPHFTNFKKYVCQYFSPMPMPACSGFLQNVRIVILYSAFDPKSRTFFTKQLMPVWEEMRNAIEFELRPIPSGRSVIDDDDNLICEYGPEECEAHRVQNCLIAEGIPGLLPIIEDANQRLRMLGCLMKNGKKGAPYPTKKCLDHVVKTNTTALEEVIRKCSERLPPDKKISDPPENYNYLGHEVALQAYVATAEIEYPLQKLPTVMIYGEKKPAAVTRLKKTICGLLDPKPAECGGTLAAPSILFPYAMLFLFFPLL